MPANEASKKVLLKNNFMREGLIRQASYWAGKGVVDLEIYRNTSDSADFDV